MIRYDCSHIIIGWGEPNPPVRNDRRRSIVICVPERILLQVGQASRDSLSLSVSFLCPTAAVILRFSQQ